MSSTAFVSLIALSFEGFLGIWFIGALTMFAALLHLDWSITPIEKKFPRKPGSTLDSMDDRVLFLCLIPVVNLAVSLFYFTVIALVYFVRSLATVLVTSVRGAVASLFKKSDSTKEKK